MGVLAALFSLATAVGTSAVPLPPPPDGVEATYEYGQEFVTIGDAGNRPTYPEETPGFPYWGMGGVGYEFRMARTEVTVGQWFDFVRAYDQFFDPPRVDSAFSSLGVRWDFAGRAGTRWCRSIIPRTCRESTRPEIATGSPTARP